MQGNERVLFIPKVSLNMIYDFTTLDIPKTNANPQTLSLFIGFFFFDFI